MPGKVYVLLCIKSDIGDFFVYRVFRFLYNSLTDEGIKWRPTTSKKLVVYDNTPLKLLSYHLERSNRTRTH